MDVLSVVLDVFEEVGVWFSSFVPTVTHIFWTAPTDNSEGSLTFLGVLAVAGLAISVVFLVMGVIQNFLHFRG